MSLNNKDKSILGQSKPDFVDATDDFLLSIKNIYKDEEAIAAEQAKAEKTVSPKLAEAKEKLQEVIDAANGARKVIKQIYGQDPRSSVKVLPHEKELKKAIRKVFGKQQATEEITFAMYEAAINERRELADKIKEAMIDEQTRTIPK